MREEFDEEEIHKSGYWPHQDGITSSLSIKKLRKLVNKNEAIGKQLKGLLKLIMLINNRETMEALYEYNNIFLDVVAVSNKRCFRKHGGIKYDKNIHDFLPKQIGLIIDHTMYNRLYWVKHGEKLVDAYFVYDELFNN